MDGGMEKEAEVKRDYGKDFMRKPCTADLIPRERSFFEDQGSDA
jgi:hypothetical protein